MLELKTRPVGASQAHVAQAHIAEAHVAFENPQPRRLLLALVLLLVALTGVVLKDRQFWFGNEQNLLDDDATTTTAAAKNPTTLPKPVPAAVNQAKSAATHATRKQIPTAIASTQPAAAPAVTRAVLPPLDVEVIAGDAHHRVHPGSNAAKLEITNQESSTLTAPTNAAQREPVADAAQASYPLLAQHMNVQGSVVLQAVIGSDGVIQTLHVISGPAILSTAAQQAVREWRFKPVLQNGAPVETQARITVNFTIKVGENSGTTLAESRTEGIQILSR